MIRIGICDDSLQDRERLVGYIKEFFEGSDNGVELSEYESAETFLQKGEADILFLDIEMAQMNGIEVKDRLQKEQIRTRIIFTTSHDEMMEEAFGKQVFGFLVKPISREKLKNKLEIVLQDMEEEYQVEITGTVEEYYAKLKQILYVQANGKYSDVKLENQEILFSDKSIGTWMEELKGKGFFLCHRSYLVNLYHIKRIENEITLLNGEKIPISRRMKKDVKIEYKEYIKRKAR